MSRPGRYNLRLIERAIRAGWAIPEATQAKLLDHLQGIVEAGHERNILAAARCLLAADQARVRSHHPENRTEPESTRPGGPDRGSAASAESEGEGTT